MQPDYSRQILLKEIGPQGQAVLARAPRSHRGRGRPRQPGAAISGGRRGRLSWASIDADTLDASNLHRQPIYRPGRCRQGKSRAGHAPRCKRINPAVQVEAHAVRLDADNALALIRGYDVVVDCSDNFRTKYLINDAAVLAQRPAVFASVYQYEGQLQVYKPEPSHACLRCLWPDAVADGVVGNCAEAGVLGPVPGDLRHAAGAVDAENSLGMPGQLEGSCCCWISRISPPSSSRRRAAPSAAPRTCAHIREIWRARIPTSRLRCDSLADAVRPAASR